MSVRRRQIADRLDRWLEEGRRLKEFRLSHCDLAKRVAESNSRMGRYLRRRAKRWAEFMAWAAR